MKLSNFAKYIDQPLIVNKVNKAMPALLCGSSLVYGVYDTFKNNKKEDISKPKKALRNTIILGLTVASSLICARGGKIGNKKIFEGLLEFIPEKELIKKQSTAVNTFLEKNSKLSQDLVTILEKAKTKPLSLKEVDILVRKLSGSSDKKELFKTLFSISEGLKSKEIFQEIKKLSIMGLVPVLGGITGGLIADKMINNSTPHSKADKIKEGFYQYLANIFLCNVGAATALFSLEQFEKRGIVKNITPLKKMLAVSMGIVTTGIIAGSFIANFIAKNAIEPCIQKMSICSSKNNKCGVKNSLYSERVPEALDVALHVDDIATVGVLSGIKWIEPILPLFYAISGYRAGIGYRNNLHCHNYKHEKHPQHINQFMFKRDQFRAAFQKFQ